MDKLCKVKLFCFDILLAHIKIKVTTENSEKKTNKIQKTNKYWRKLYQNFPKAVEIHFFLIIAAPEQ